MTPKQQRFVEEYLIDLNATQAAIRAGYSQRTAYEIGHQNLNKLEIQAALQEAFAARSKRMKIDQDAVIRELAAIATADIRDLFTEDGAPRPIQELDEDLAVAIASLQMLERRADDGQISEYVYRVRLSDKIRALDLLGRHLGMFSDRVR